MVWSFPLTTLVKALLFVINLNVLQGCNFGPSREYDGLEIIPIVRTILCVDDHPAALQAISMLLESRGYRCVTASNPEEALRLLAENTIDLAVVDHWLTETTGTALAVQMKAIRNIPIIMFTGDPDLKDAPEPVDLLLGKPQVPEDLLAFVAALLPDDQEQSAKKIANGL